MRTALKILGILVVGTLLGLGATWLAVVRGTWGGAVSDGPWKTSLTTGSRDAGMYQRAAVAVHGLLALNRSETIYYTAGADSDGAALSGACVYRIDGRDPPARWWSITAYGADDYLIPNRAGLYSVSRNSVARGDDGRFAVRVSKDAAGGERHSGGGRRLQPDAQALQSRCQGRRRSGACRVARDPQGALRMSALARNWQWLAATLAVAVVVHVASVIAVPRLIMGRTMAVISKAGGINAMAFGRRPTAAARGVVRPSPDLLYATCVYDLDAAGGALRVRASGMPKTYWSVSLFDAATDNFHVVNDRQAKGGAVDFVIVAAGAPRIATPLPVVVSPTARGLVLLRTLIDDDKRLAEIDAARRHAACGPYTAAP
ncbi:MAG: DUF1254 domain-containing protein [Rhizomicrobium sp.]